MRVTPQQRWITFAVSIFAAGCSVKLASDGGAFGWPPPGWAWYIVAVLFLVAAWMVAILPSPPADAPVIRRSPAEASERRWAVAIAFHGAPPLVFDRLLADGYKIGGHGPCDDAPDHDGFVTVEVWATSRDLARGKAGRAVRTAGARVEKIGEALPAAS